MEQPYPTITFTTVAGVTLVVELERFKIHISSSGCSSGCGRPLKLMNSRVDGRVIFRGGSIRAVSNPRNRVDHMISVSPEGAGGRAGGPVCKMNLRVGESTGVFFSLGEETEKGQSAPMSLISIIKTDLQVM